jgi:hypothetical protein
MTKKTLVFLGSEHSDFINESNCQFANVTFLHNSSFREARPLTDHQDFDIVDIGADLDNKCFPSLSSKQNRIFSDLLDTPLLTDKSCMYAWERQISVVDSLTGFRNLQGFHTLLYTSHIVKLLTERNFDLLIFFYTPHNLFTIILSRVAAYLQITTLVMRPTILPYVSWLSKIQINSHSTSESNYFYDWNINLDQNRMMELVDASIKLLTSSLPSKRELSVRKFKYKPAISIQNILKSIYLRQIIKYFKSQDDIDLSSSPYVVFYLHYQPESTTSPDAGNHFYDMLSAITLLRKQLPLDYKLIIKEHPATFKPSVFNHLWRCRRFYQYISQLPNTLLLSPNVSNSEIFSSVQAISSISGSVCSEALSKGIKVISFSPLNLLPSYDGQGYLINSARHTSIDILSFLQSPITPEVIKFDFHAYLHNLPYKYFSYPHSLSTNLVNPSIPIARMIRRSIFRSLLLSFPHNNSNATTQ